MALIPAVPNNPRLTKYPIPLITKYVLSPLSHIAKKNGIEFSV